MYRMVKPNVNISTKFNTFYECILIYKQDLYLKKWITRETNEYMIVLKLNFHFSGTVLECVFIDSEVVNRTRKGNNHKLRLLLF